MEQAILSDRNQYPTDEIIFSQIGKSKSLWQSLFDFIHTAHSDFTEEWRYYNDGKSWLMKVQRKKKTVFWLSIIKDSFRTTFYFPDKAKNILLKSTISDALKKQYKEGKNYGKIRGITINYKNKRDVEDAKALMNIKLSLK